MPHTSSDMLVYAACCQDYFDNYGKAFVGSAKANGHNVIVLCDGMRHATLEEKRDYRVTYLKQRFAVMPDLLRQHGSLLMCDIDTVFLEPVKIAEDIDLGIFLRPWADKPRYRTLASAFYIHERAMPFAEALANAAAQPGFVWGDDQRVLWELYLHHRHTYNVSNFDQRFIDWRWPTTALLYTAKGPVKESADFARQLDKWAPEAGVLAC